MQRTSILISITGVLLAIFSQVSAAALIDFEDLSDTDLVTTQYVGVSFTDAMVLQAGTSLNEFEFPPHSGVKVVFDFGGPIVIDFLIPALTVNGFVTYSEPLSITAFSSSFLPLAVLPSLFSSNLALSGDVGSSPIEFLSFADLGGIG
jgi:hypothetical protein